MDHDRLISFRPEIQDFGPGKLLVSVMHMDRTGLAPVQPRADEGPIEFSGPQARFVDELLDALEDSRSSFWSRLKAWFERWCEVPR